MVIEFNCPTCGRKLGAEDASVGKRAKCKACGKMIRIPYPGEKDPRYRTTISADADDIPSGDRETEEYATTDAKPGGWSGDDIPTAIEVPSGQVADPKIRPPKLEVAGNEPRETGVFVPRSCPSCNKAWNVDVGLSGIGLKCSQCGEPFKLPVEALRGEFTARYKTLTSILIIAPSSAFVAAVAAAAVSLKTSGPGLVGAVTVAVAFFCLVLLGAVVCGFGCREVKQEGYNFFPFSYFGPKGTYASAVVLGPIIGSFVGVRFVYRLFRLNSALLRLQDRE